MSELGETKLYKLNKKFADAEGLPVFFVGRQLKETPKAAYLFGHGTTEVQTRFNSCCKCGLTLSHPGSILLGIGPYCLGDMGLREQILQGLSEVEVNEIIGKAVANLKVDKWIPKSCIKEVHDTTDIVEIPEGHPMLNGKKPSGGRRAFLSNENKIVILFPFDYKDLERVKSLAGPRYHHDRETNEKWWTCPLSVESAQSLQDWGFSLGKSLELFLEKAKIDVNEISGIEIPGLKGKLFDFQAKGVAFIERKNGRALIADEQGLGKSVESAAWLQLRRELRPAIIVVPASLKENWKRELERFLPDPNVQTLSGTKANEELWGDIFVINYDILFHWVDRLREVNPQVLIVDEIQLTKSSKAKRTGAVKTLGKNIPHIIGLSGTPIVNRPQEALNTIQLIDRSVAPSAWKFLHEFCAPKHNGFGWDFSGASNTDKLHKLLTSTIMLRRLKKDVLPELPEKIRSFVPIEIDNPAEYANIKNNFIKHVRETRGEHAARKASNAEHLTKIEALKQVAVKGKMQALKSWIHDFLDTGNKLVVFAIHKETINALMEEFKGVAIKLDGSIPTTGGHRQRIVDQFQNDPNTTLFVGNIQAAGVGWTLTAAYSEAVVELPWTPGACAQIEDRIHRIGQLKGVNIYYLLAMNTIEEEVAALLDSKRNVIYQVLDGKEAEADESILKGILDAYTA